MTTDSLILGRYRLDREIAVGGTARVWRARDAKQDRAVAVKLLHPHLLPDATSRRRLEGEARAAEGPRRTRPSRPSTTSPGRMTTRRW